MEQQDPHDDVAEPKRPHGALAVLLALLLVAALGAGAFYLLLPRVTGAFSGPKDYPGPGSGAVTVTVSPGQSSSAIARQLADRGVVASAEAFADAATRDERSQGIQPGVYRLRRQMKAGDALAMLLDPTSRQVLRLTVPEGLRTGETLDLLAKRTGIRRADFTRALANPSALGVPAWAGRRADGLLFPATYAIEPGAKPVDILSMMVRRFRAASDKVGLQRGAVVGGRRYTPLQVLTVASIAQAEAKPPVMAKVTRVLYNRLAKGQKLQLDTTVDFATGKRGITTTARDRASASRYNTYRVAGLPPGPIDAPGEHALQAALHPAPGPWTYFVAVNPDTGETRFGTSKADHDRNVALLQRWLAAHPGR